MISVLLYSAEGPQRISAREGPTKFGSMDNTEHESKNHCPIYELTYRLPFISRRVFSADLVEG